MTANLPATIPPPRAILIPSLGLVRHELDAAGTIADIVGRSRVRNLDRVRVTIGADVIPREAWSRVRPRGWALVVVRIVPGDSDLLRTGLILAVTVAAVAAGQLYAPGIALSLFGPSASALLATGGLAASSTQVALTSALIAAGGATVGAIAVNALIPPEALATTKDPRARRPNYAIQGLRNQATPGAVFPLLLGWMRVSPPYLALPYTSWSGETAFIHAAFLVGYGRLTMSNERIGRTGLDRFAHSIQSRSGADGDDELSVYPRQVIEERIDAELLRSDPATQRSGAGDATRFEFDVGFPQGLAKYNKDGSRGTVPVVFRLDFRRTDIEDDWVEQRYRIAGRRAQPFGRTLRFIPNNRGDWEFQFHRETDDHDVGDEQNITSRSDWLLLRTIRPEYILNSSKHLAVVAMRMRGTRQHSGQLDTFNVLAKSVFKDWDHSEEEWVMRETRNPGALWPGAWQGQNMAYPVPDDQFDWDSLVELHDHCRLLDLEYDAYHTSQIGAKALADLILAAGHATKIRRNGKWGAVIDRPQTEVVAHISPRNSWGFGFERTFMRPPDAYRIKFLDRTRDYVAAERIVAWPGFEGEPTVFEEVTIPGCTNPDQIWIQARRLQYIAIHRRNTYTVMQGWEHLQAVRGGLVMLNHVVLRDWQVSARVRSVDDDVVTLDTPVVLEDATSYAIRFRRADGSSSLRSITGGVPGPTYTLTLSSAVADLAEDDLALFGKAGFEARECIVKDIERGDGDLVARLTLIDHAPQIATLTAAEVPPEWTGRIGDPIEGIGVLAPPVIDQIASGDAAREIDPDLTGVMPVIVLLSPGDNIVDIVGWRVEHRLVGAGSWDEATGSTDEDYVRLGGSAYADGDHIQVRGYAIDEDDNESDPTDIVEFVVGSDNRLVPAVTALSMRPLNDETWRYTWTLSEPEVVASVEIAVAAGEEADFDDLFPAGTTSPLSPLDYGAPGGDGLFTFGVRPIDTAGNPGTPRIAHSYRGTIADALFARMSVQPNAVRKNEYRTLLARLDEASILTKLDALYLLGAHDEQAAYLNLVQAAYDLSETGTGTFTANRGWQGDGSTGYLDSGFNPATAGGLYAQDDAHMGVWVRTEQQSAAAAIGNTRAFIRPRNTSDQMATRGNQSAAADVTAMASSVGHSMWSRIDATQYRRYRDGVSAGLLSVASDTLSSLPLYIGGSNLTADEHYPGQIFAVHWGASLSSGEAAKLHEIILAYAVAVGAA